MSTLGLTDRRLLYCYRLVAFGAFLWVLLVGLWEIGSPFGAGHVAVLPARGIMADNMLSWGIWYPVRDYTAALPKPTQAYAHHPWGSYYVFAALRYLFGRHEWVIRLFPVAVNCVMPLLLGAVARRLWGTVAGALAALGWAVLPITLCFAQFPSFELFSVFTWVCLTWGAVRFVETWEVRDGAIVVVASFLAAHSDWIGALYAVLVLVWGLFAVAFWPKLSLELGQVRRALRIAVLSGLAVAGSVLLYALLFRKLGLAEDWLGSATYRALDNDLPLTQVLSHRRYWIEAMFTKPGVALGVIGALAMVIRVATGRRWADVLPLLMLAVALFHYVYFKNGADTHIYWPLPFAVQFCLGLGLLGAECGRLLVFLLERAKRPFAAPEGTLLAMGLLGGAVAALLPDALRSLDYARNTGCRLNDDGYLNLQDLDKTAALRFFANSMGPRDAVGLHASMGPNWAQAYALMRPTVFVGNGGSRLGFPQAAFTLFDARQAPDLQLGWAQGYGGVRVVGPYWMVARSSMMGPLQAWGFEERAPTLFEWMFVQAHDPIRRIVPDPYRTWELRRHLNQNPNPEPPPPRTLEQSRVWYNVAVARGDQAEMANRREQLVRRLERRSAAAFTDGVELLGYVLRPGRPPTLSLYFYAENPLDIGTRFNVVSRVLEAATASFVVADDKVKQLAAGFEIPPSRWRPHMIYSLHVELRPRPGREAFFGTWSGPGGPQPLPGGAALLPLFELD